ncbi:hypothetical protein [Endozoicomonas elysicola]|uniref:Uncharacterized protein n=1 Tax=Endozoicomonas elysicola TaxID=305900 RepID=A0A081K790_9GAMM|nr:hypothetical protein [Endozoicomonas elysicola]KEI70016.1 hypothetical protein GV64_03975 [Endozoicomonas elysicola]
MNSVKARVAQFSRGSEPTGSKNKSPVTKQPAKDKKTVSKQTDQVENPGCLSRIRMGARSVKKSFNDGANSVRKWVQPDGKGTPLEKRRVAALVIGGIGLAACGLALCTEAGVVILGGAAVAGGVYYYYRRTHQTNG